MLQIEEHVPLAPLTTIQLGGAARYFVRCRSTEELTEALGWVRKQKLSWHVLGGGSNTIFQDSGFPGLVVKIELKGMAFGKEHVVVAAGEEWDPFVAACVEKNLAGVECLSGIPGLAGATPIQNVGAYGQEVAQVIEAVTALEVNKRREVTFENKDCGFAYRWSRFKGEDAGKYVITQVTFKLTAGGKPNISYAQVREELSTPPSPSPRLRGGSSKKISPSSEGELEGVSLHDIREAVLRLRKRKSMVVDTEDPNSRSCGSFFENLELTGAQLAALQERAGGEVPTFEEAGIVRVPTAWLIEKAGYPKGTRRVGVGVSPNHNLALVNFGGTAQELLALSEEIVAAVREKFGVELKQEPILVSA
jgi:UDP-N-acetylmuramate dehydrogenase